MQNAAVIAVRIVVGVVGAIVVLRTLLSAVRTIVVPRAQKAWLTRFHFVTVLQVFRLFARPSMPFKERDRIMALYAPIGLVLLPAVWLLLIISGFAAIYWAIHEETLGESFVLSGSSATTLGFLRPEHDWVTALSFLEAAIGLGVVALMISYLPTIYSAFARREALVGMLEVRAGGRPRRGCCSHATRRSGGSSTSRRICSSGGSSGSSTSRSPHTSQPSLGVLPVAVPRTLVDQRRRARARHRRAREPCNRGHPEGLADQPHDPDRFPRAAAHRRLLRHASTTLTLETAG